MNYFSKVKGFDEVECFTVEYCFLTQLDPMSFGMRHCSSDMLDLWERGQLLMITLLIRAEVIGSVRYGERVSVEDLVLTTLNPTEVL